MNMLGKMKRMLATLLMLALLAGGMPAFAEEAIPAVAEISEASAEPLQEEDAFAEESSVESAAEPIADSAAVSEAAPAPETSEAPAADQENIPAAEPVPEEMPESDELPTEEPSAAPSAEPTAEPSVEQVEDAPASAEPTAAPAVEPTAEPAVEPTAAPSMDPTIEYMPESALPQIILNAEALTLGISEKFTLTAALSNADAADFDFVSINTRVATIDEDGLITAKKAGEAKILVTSNGLLAECIVTVVKAPTKVSLSASKLSLAAGDTALLTAELNNGNEGRVTFSTSKASVATVDENGVITAVGKGTAKITATSYNKKKASCTVTVVAAPESITLEETELILPVGMEAQLEARVNKGAAARFRYSSSDESIASVDADGKITTHLPGTAVLTVSTFNGLTAECTVTVTEAPESIRLVKEFVELGAKESLQLEVVNDKGCEVAYSYSSSNTKVATVDKNGVVTAKKAGTAVITATSYNGLTADCEISVGKAPSKVTLSAKSLDMGEGQSETLVAEINSGSFGAVAFSSSKESVATVDENGVITAVSKGTAKITAKTYNGKKATCTVSVLAAPQSLMLAQTEASLPMGMALDLKPSVEKGAMANYTCSSSDEAVARVSNSGKVTAIGIGTAIISVSTYNGLTASCKVTVTPAPSGITLNAYQHEMGVGDEFQITAAADQAGDAGFSYKSKSDRIAAVSKNGLVTAKKTGTTTITVTSFNGVSAECEITVKKAPTSIKFNLRAITLTAGSQEDLEYELSSGSAGSVQFSSSDENIARVDENGLITAIAAGVAKITATTYNGKKASCTVTVEDPENTISALRTEGNSAIATVNTVQACRLYVEVLDENSEESLMNASAEVEAGLQMADIAAELPAPLPNFYILSAVLLDEDGNALCSPYITKRYTTAYSQFENQTPESFPADRVLNLGSAGYAVYSSTTYPVNSSVTESGGKYTFLPPAKLEPGYVVIIDEQPVKIKTVTYNDDGTATITKDNNVYLSDIYDVLKLNETIQVGKQAPRSRAALPEGDTNFLELSSSISFGPVEVAAKAGISLHVRVAYDKKFFGADYVEYEVYADVKGSLETSISAEFDSADWPANPLNIPLYDDEVWTSIPGVVIFVYVDVPFDLRAKAAAKAEVGFNIRTGYKFDPVNQYQPIKDKDLDADVSAEGELELRFGPKISIDVAIVCLRGKISGQFGVQAKGVVKGLSTSTEYSADKSYYHACTTCVDLNVAGFTDIKGALEYRISSKLSGTLAELKLFCLEWEIGDAFISVINDLESIYGGNLKFGWGDCQNRKYRVRVSTVDKDGKPLTGKPVTITGDKTDELKGLSRTEDYLYPGSYKAAVQFDTATVQQGFSVTDAALDVTVSESVVNVEGTVTDNETGAAIPGATVEITLPGGEIRSLTTDEKGCYRLESVPAGEYAFAFSADKYEKREITGQNFIAGSNNRVDAALVPEVPDNSSVPFLTTQAKISGEEIEMGGVSYADAVVFTMGYTGLSSTGGIAEAVYNFKGQYSSMSFDAGYCGGWERDAEMTVIADGVVVLDKVKMRYEDIARRYTVSLAGVHQLVIHFESRGYDKAKYAIGDISLVKSGSVTGKPRTSDADFDSCRYLMDSTWKIDGNFTMGGYNYRNGYRMSMGYGWSIKETAKLGFNFRGKYSNLSFDIARISNDYFQHYLRSALLTIEVDGVPVAGYNELELKWNDITRPISVNISGASQVVIKLTSKGYDKLDWGIGNIQLTPS